MLGYLAEALTFGAFLIGPCAAYLGILRFAARRRAGRPATKRKGVAK